MSETVIRHAFFSDTHFEISEVVLYLTMNEGREHGAQITFCIVHCLCGFQSAIELKDNSYLTYTLRYRPLILIWTLTVRVLSVCKQCTITDTFVLQGVFILCSSKHLCIANYNTLKIVKN